jgi:diguanylate cyclase (GGDEF)-like protein
MVAVRSFGISLLVDGVFIQTAHERLGHGPGVDSVVAAHLVATCLLASFRTGQKLAVWQSMLMVLAWRGEQNGLLPHAVGMLGADREKTVITDTLLIWLVAITTSVAAAINERELRRRRYDAEALERLAASLLTDELSGAVIHRLRAFVVEELGVLRAVVVNHGGPAQRPSALLDLASGREGATQALRLDSTRESVLNAELPDALRLAAIPLRSPYDGEGSRFLVMEFGKVSWRTGRVERRVLAAATQAAATAAIALSRAELIEQAQRAAVTDGLTGLPNRRAFDVKMAECERAWREEGMPFAVALADVDHFKSVNDRLGHQVGDQVLAAVATLLLEAAGRGPFVARYGGEEFALVLPGGDAAAAAALAERVRRSLREADHAVRVTASLGVAAVPEDADSVESVVRAADTALYHSKNTGRDRVTLAGPRPRVPAARGPIG